MNRIENRHIIIALLMLSIGAYLAVLAQRILDMQQEVAVVMKPAQHGAVGNRMAALPAAPFRSVTPVHTPIRGSRSGMPMPTMRSVAGGALHAGSSAQAHSVGGGIAAPALSANTSSHRRQQDPTATVPVVMVSTSSMLAYNSRYESVQTQDGGPARVVQRAAARMPEFPDDPGYGPQFPNEPGEGVDTPIGDVPLGMLLLFSLLFLSYKRKFLRITRE